MGIFGTPEAEQITLCEQWCRNITTEEYIQKQSTIEEGRCICRISMPIPSSWTTD